MRTILAGMPTTVALSGTFFSTTEFAPILAFSPIILMAVQSIGGLKLYEIMLVAVFEAVAIFYVYKQQ